MDSELERIEREKIELLKKEVEFVNCVEKNEFIQRLSDLKLKLDSRKKSLGQYIQESGSKSSAKPAEVVKDRRKRCFNSTISDADQWMNKDGSGSKQAKIVLYCEAPNEQLTRHPEKSGKLSNPLAQIQNELEAREFEVVAKPAQEICIEGKRRGSGDGFAGEVFIMDSQRQDGKRRCLREGLTEHIKAPPPPPPPPQNSGSYVTSEAKASPNVAIVEESESLLDNCQLIEKLKVGDVWCCFDLEDSLPRSQVQITRIITNWDGKVMLRIKWLKPCPVYGGEKEWIDAHLPATCGNFISSRSSTESPKILSHLASTNGNGPWTIIPRIGETWAIYKDWDISTWSSNPKIHGNCKYEIVEILSYHRDGSSLCFRVGYLNEIPRSQCHSFLIERSNMYRFSHRVPSTKNHCIDVNGILHFTFELDKRSLPKGLL